MALGQSVRERAITRSKTPPPIPITVGRDMPDSGTGTSDGVGVAMGIGVVVMCGVALVVVVGMLFIVAVGTGVAVVVWPLAV